MSKVLSVIIVLALLGLGVMGVMYFAKQDKGGANNSANESTPGGTSSEAAGDSSDTQLDTDLGEIELEDPETEVKTTVDSDINSL